MAINANTSRRAFFLKGGAAMGAGVAAAADAVAGVPAAGTQVGADQEAIRQLHLAFISRMENQAFEAAADLFSETGRLQLSDVAATGKEAILQALIGGYREHKAASLHNAYRPNALQLADMVKVDETRQRAVALYHVDVQISSPLQGNCTAAQMARLQGQMGDCRWEAGRLRVKYEKSHGHWKIAALDYLA